MQWLLILSYLLCAAALIWGAMHRAMHKAYRDIAERAPEPPRVQSEAMRRYEQQGREMTEQHQQNKGRKR